MNRILRGRYARRRNPISDAPFHQDWIAGKTRAKAFDVLVQCLPQFDEHRSEFLVLLCSKKLCGQFANFIVHSTHGTTLHQDDAVARH